MAIVITPDGRRSVLTHQGYPFAPTSVTSWGNTLHQTIPLSGGLTGTYGYIMRTQPWCFIVVNKLAKSVANLPLHTYTVASDGDKKRVRAGSVTPGPTAAKQRLPQLFRRPTPTMSEYDWKYSLVWELLVYGNYLGVKVGDGLPYELWTVPWHSVEVIEGKSRPIDGYKVTVGNQVFPFTPEEVVHLQNWRGMSALEPLRRTLAIEDAALRETQASFENSMRINGVLTAPATGVGSRQLSKDDTDTIRAQFESSYGGVDKAYRTAVVGGGLTWTGMQFSHNEAQLIPVRQLAREEVAAALDVPPPIVGILDHATYSNFDQAHRSYYMDSVAPLCVKVEEGLEVQLVQPEPEWAGLDLEFSLDEVMKSDLASRSEAYTKLTRVGFSLDDILALENKPPKNTPLSTTSWVPQELMPTDPEALAIWKDSKPQPARRASDAPPPPEPNADKAEQQSLTLDEPLDP